MYINTAFSILTSGISAPEIPCWYHFFSKFFLFSQNTHIHMCNTNAQAFHAATQITLKSQYITLLSGLNLTVVLAPTAYPFILVGILDRLYARPCYFEWYPEKEKKCKKKNNNKTGNSLQNGVNLECFHSRLLCFFLS